MKNRPSWPKQPFPRRITMKAIKVALLLLTCLSLLLAGCGKSTRTMGGVKVGTFPRGRDADGSKVIVKTTFHNKYKYPVEVAPEHGDYVLVMPGRNFSFKSKTYKRFEFSIRTEIEVGYGTELTRTKFERSGLYAYGDVIVLDQDFIFGKLMFEGKVSNDFPWAIKAWDSYRNHYGVLETGQTVSGVQLPNGPMQFICKVVDPKAPYGLRNKVFRISFNINNRNDYRSNDGRWIGWEFSFYQK